MRIREFSGCILFDERDKILLQYRGEGYKHMNNSWSFFGGKLEDNETREDCISREILEELNHKLKSEQYVTSGVIKSEFNGELETHIVHIFIEKVNKKEIEKLKLLEGDDWNWFSIDDALKLEMHKINKDILERIRNLIEDKD